MPRLRNTVTGAVMSVSAHLATLLGSEWVDADKAVKEPTASAKRAANARKSDD